MPGGWGKRATGKIGRNIEDDKLFKEIGGQLDSSNFDYSQWQRSRKEIANVMVKNVQPKSINDKLVFKVGPGGQFFRRGKLLQDACQHTHYKKEAPKDVYQDAKIEDKIQILQLRIKTKLQIITEYRKREKELLDQNLGLQNEIESEEKSSHDAVKKLLRKYERFRGGVSTLSEKFIEDQSMAIKDFNKFKQKLGLELSVLEQTVEAVDQKLQERLHELSILLSYKDKEYPVKALKIADLSKEISQLKNENESEQAELKRVVETEVAKMKKTQDNIRHIITTKATEESLSEMHPSLKDMAMHNMVMKKEIEFHTKEKEELQILIDNIQKEVKQLVKDPKTNIRQEMFPEIFLNRPKCTPDMDVILDIPIQEWLPI